MSYNQIQATLTVTATAGEHGSVYATTVSGQPIDLSNPLTYGQKIYLHATPDEGYEVDEWTNYNPMTGLTVTASVAVAVTFKKQAYHVRFVDFDNTVLKEEDVLYQEAATAPADPTREGYKFTGWDKDFSAVKEDMTVKAQYEELSEGFESVFTGENAAKILRNGQIYILRGEKTYTVTGQKVK